MNSRGRSGIWPFVKNAEQKMIEHVKLPVEEDDAIYFHEAWFSGKTDGVGAVAVSRVLHAPLIRVSVTMKDGRTGRYTLDLEEAVRELLEAEFPELTREDPNE